MSVLIQDSLAATLGAKVARLPASAPTVAYIQGLFIDQAEGRRVVDYSRQSLLLAYSEAQKAWDLHKVQSLADYTLWVLTWFPAHVEASRSVVETVGRLSYSRCYRMVPSWRLFQELADQLPVFVEYLA